MREATLGGLSALDTVRPTKGAARPRGPAGPAKKSQTRNNGGFRRFRARFALIAGSAGFTAIMIGIVLNATVMQKEHHPAPLFGGASAPAAPPRATAPVAPPPVVAPAVVQPAAALDAPPAAAPVSLPLPAVDRPAALQSPKSVSHAGATHRAPVHAVAHAGPVHHADPIGQLIGRSGGADLHHRAAHAAKGAPAKHSASNVAGKATTAAAQPLQLRPAHPKATASVPQRSIPVVAEKTTAGVN